jgi:pilus assembly protein Flp/PilA
MQKLASAVRSFVRDEEGATTAEYGIIVVVMAAIAFAVLQTLNGSMETLYGGAQDKVDDATTYTP